MPRILICDFMLCYFVGTDNRLRELERQMGNMRSLRDQVDELEVLKADREKLSKDNIRYFLYL